MEQFFQQRNQIVHKLLALDDKASGIDTEVREFLLHYFQFHEDLSNTYVYYPLKLGNDQIVFETVQLFTQEGQKAFELLLKSKIVGMIYFYADFNKDMSLAESEKLRVNIFLEPQAAKGFDELEGENLSYINSLDSLPLNGLRKICQSYF